MPTNGTCGLLDSNGKHERDDGGNAEINLTLTSICIFIA
jgi:hypothetical protein